MAREKGDKVINGKLVKAKDLVQESITSTNANDIETITISTAVLDETVDSDFPARGLELSEALKDTEIKVNEQTVSINIKDGRIVTTMTGIWDGRLLHAAMRSIEKQYDQVRRHGAVWAMKQSQNNNTSKVI